MHSSRMRTVRSSGRISGGVYLVPGGTWSGRGCVHGPGRVYLVSGGCTWSGVTWSQGGTWFWGGEPGPRGWGVPGSGGVPGPRGVYLVQGMYLVAGGVLGPRGVYLVLGGLLWVGVPGQVLPPCGQTHACKNITFATSLRTVIKSECKNRMRDILIYCSSLTLPIQLEC